MNNVLSRLCFYVTLESLHNRIKSEDDRNFIMNPKFRRILQAILYELIAIAFVGPVLSLVFNKSPASTFGLAFVLSTVALVWNFVFNTFFERWESRQTIRGRSWTRRLAHGFGFEGGLVVILAPIMVFWLKTTAIKAFMANLSILAFFFVYAIAFTWAFDRVFGLPTSAVTNDETTHCDLTS